MFVYRFLVGMLSPVGDCSYISISHWEVISSNWGMLRGGRGPGTIEIVDNIFFIIHTLIASSNALLWLLNHEGDISFYTWLASL